MKLYCPYRLPVQMCTVVSTGKWTILERIWGRCMQMKYVIFARKHVMMDAPLQHSLQRACRAVGVRSFLRTIICVMYSGKGKEIMLCTSELYHLFFIDH
jgi:hypothetical protein